ncbi:MAG: G8 domain-containing protein [Armatimonadota bacterium]|nr:G8 domain-containing protein [Armatimonadota bacterium]
MPSLHAQTADVSSIRSGLWSDPNTWSTRRVPQRGERVTVAAGHTVTYNVYSDVEVGRLLIRGTLVFARDRNTRLDVGNVIVDDGGYLEMGTAANPIPAAYQAEIRFVISSTASCTGGASFVERDTGLWVFGGGRWEAHGAPVRVTWTKLAARAAAGVSVIRVVDDVTDWEPGSTLVVTPTDMGRREASEALSNPYYEEVQLVRAIRMTGHTELQLSRTLRYTHEGTGETAGEVALLSRNVVVTSKYPDDQVQGHTMFMHGAEGGLSYVEFRQLGNLGCLSRYPVHFHMMEETSRGMRVRGLAIWDSNTQLLNIHASHGVTVEDTIGYHGTGIGFFVGEPHERMFSVDNVLVNNLVARIVYRDGALNGAHRASGFWIESLNAALVGNVASGSWGRSLEDAGFHIAEGPDFHPDFGTLQMVRNESHTNNGSGLHTWNNSGPPYAVVDFRAWRNGFAGIKWGAYRNRMHVHRALLFENGTYNLQTTAIQIFVADSQLFGTTAYATPIGLYIDRYFISNDPASPSEVHRSTFSGHQDHVAQSHTRCPSSAEERDPRSRECSASYMLFADNRFNGGTAFDFGWHRNANSYFHIRNWNGTASPTIAATQFRLTRRDRPRPSTLAYLYEPYDAWLDPAAASPARPSPPLVTLSGLVDGAALGSSVTFAPTIAAASGVARVTYYVDERAVATQTSGTFRFTWSSSGWTRRYAHVYVAVTDRNGATGYSQVIRLRR